MHARRGGRGFAAQEGFRGCLEEKILSDIPIYARHIGSLQETDFAITFVYRRRKVTSGSRRSH